MVTISNVNNKYLSAKESSYGVTPDPFTSVGWGHIQTFSVGEEENMEKIRGINSGHTASLFEDGLYWSPVSIKGYCTKASLPIILEFVLGTKTETTDYAIVSDNTKSNSYSFKVSYTADKIILVNGFTVKDFEITSAKGETVAYTINGIAKKSSVATEDISVTKITDAIFKDLDCKVSIGGTATFVLNSFNISGNWNVTDDEGRGIEAVSAGERRLIQRVIKHGLDISGNYEAEVDNNAEFGYTETRTDKIILFTISRGSDNEHIFTLTNTRSGNRDIELTTDNTKRIVSYNYEALDVSVAGDL